jgi:acyl-CoA thioester hydrolase
MSAFTIQITTRWSDVDANGHVRNTAYSDFATQGRIAFLKEYGLTMDTWEKHHIGPVLVREELIYKRELRLLDRVTVTCEVKKASRDYKKFGIVQHILNEEGKEAAQVAVETLWMSMETRRVVAPPPEMLELMLNMPKSEDFEWWEK